MEQTNQPIKATWAMATKIWWWILWRSFISAVVSGFVIGFIVGFISAIAGIEDSSIQTFSGLFGGMLGIIINIFFTKKIIGKKFKDFSLVLIKTEKSE